MRSKAEVALPWYWRSFEAFSWCNRYSNNRIILVSKPSTHCRPLRKLFSTNKHENKSCQNAQDLTTMVNWTTKQKKKKSILQLYSANVWRILLMCLFVATLAIFENVPQGKKKVFMPTHTETTYLSVSIANAGNLYLAK